METASEVYTQLPVQVAGSLLHGTPVEQYLSVRTEVSRCQLLFQSIESVIDGPSLAVEGLREHRFVFDKEQANAVKVERNDFVATIEQEGISFRGFHLLSEGFEHRAIIGGSRAGGCADRFEFIQRLCHGLAGKWFQDVIDPQ